jgi:DNA-binding NarL/FixJ family response regulator
MNDLNIRILIVDDDGPMVEAQTALIQQEVKMHVAGVAYNGKEAVEKCTDLKPDIVLMDDWMPKMTGLEAAKIICERFPEIKIIMTTSRGKDAPAQAMEAGAVAVLVKPFSASELISIIRSVCG